MATRSGPNRLINPALREALVVDTVRGKLRVRAWPRKRGKPKHPHTLYMNAWMRDIAQKLKFLDSRAVNEAIQQTKQTGLYPRDLLMAASTGGVFDIALEDGTLLRHKRQGIQQVSFQGCILAQPANQNFLANVAFTVPYPIPLVDTSGFYNALNPTRLTIPPGVNICRFSATQRGTILGSDVIRCLITNPSASFPSQSIGNVGSISYAATTSIPIPVTEGDWFEHITLSGTNGTLTGGWLFFGVEVLDADIPASP